MNVSQPVSRPASGVVSTFVREQIASSLRRRHQFLGALGSILGVAHSLGVQAASPLPVPCVANCGSNPGATPFVQSGIAGATQSGNNLTVTQSSNAAILNWQQFNIDKGYSVNFKQPDATSSTLNRIWSADPSKISGNLTANGQIYLINQNGIIFGRGAQVNVGSLTASTLNISDDVYIKGVLSQNNTTASTAITQPAVFDSNGAPAGTVTVESGATLASSSSGRIILIGTAVNNAGKIATSDGQAILAAGNSVYLAASTDPALRGLLVEVNAAQLPAGSTVTNTGEITAERGNVTLAGLVVNQAGHISATTSVGSNGSIALVAGDTSSTDDPTFYQHKGGPAGFGTMLPNKGGKLTLASGSVTEVRADATDTAKLNGTQTLIPSSVDLVGKSITIQSGAAIQAPGGKVTATAADNPFHKFSAPASIPKGSDGSDILIESGAIIDTSGLRNVSVSATRNLVDVFLTSNDLQDDPLLRDGFLHGQHVTVDLDIGSTLFDTAPYKANLLRGISELLTAGGSINLDSNGSVITRAGATLNVSGGTIAYTGGFGPSTTKLLGADGKVYDIGNASKNIQYVGFANSFSYTDPTWGTKTSATSQSFHAGYVQGADAGGITILAPELYFRGTALGDTTPGIMQRSLASLPKGGSFTIGESGHFSTENNIDYRAPGLTLADGAKDDLAVDFDPAHGQVLSADDLATSLISPSMLRSGGFSTIGLYSNDAVTLATGNTLTATSGGTITLSGESVAINGNVRIPSGQLVVTSTRGAVGTDPTVATDVTVAPGALLDMSGTWINDSPLLQFGPGTAPLTYSGGSVSLKSAGSITLGTDSLVDVSGGGWIDAGNRQSAGNAGAIDLEANVGGAPDPGTGALSGGLELGGRLRGMSLDPAGGGQLKVQSASVTVGHSARGSVGELLLTPDFFMQGGFSSYSIVGQNGLAIGTPADPVTITPQHQNLVFTGSPLLQKTGAALTDFTSVETLPDWQRAPTSVSFSGTASSPVGRELGSVSLGAGSAIVTDPGATVSLATGVSGNLTVLGKISAPAGKINLSIASQVTVAQGSTDPAGYVPGQQLLLGPDAVLSATAFARVNTANRLGYRQGTELAGGSISINAWKGYVVTNPGSLIDVSGGQTVIDVVTPTGVTPTTIAGNAGSISIGAREGLVLGGQLVGKAAEQAGAAGGTLSVGLDLSNYATTSTFNNTLTPLSPYAINERVLTLTDQPAVGLPPLLVSGQALVSTGTLTSGGFDNITLRSADVVAMSGDVHVAAKGNLVIDTPVLRGKDNFTATLSAAHLSLGYYANASGQTQETLTTAAAGSGKLSANAQLIDIRGTSAFEGFSAANLNSSADVRLTFPQQTQGTQLTGSLLLSGDLNISAAQIYPTTATSFKIQSPGTVTIGPASATGTVPLSAGGVLEIDAQKIVQQGVLRAPAGQIVLNATEGVQLAAGSVTSVSTEGLIIPEGYVQNGNQWLYALDSSTNGSHIVTAPTSKEIKINAPDVAIDSGAKVDLSGGGDIYAYEFVAGQGGSRDVLAANGAYTYAIVPKLGSAFAPIDAQYNLGAAANGSQTIKLSGVPGIPDGTYALLPARYALLPGAYAVQVTKSNSDLAIGAAVKQPDGTYVTAARLGQSGTDILDSRTSTVTLASSSVVRTNSQYYDSYGSSFFTQMATAAGKAAPAISADAGELTLAATKSLSLQSAIQFNTGSYQTGTDSKGTPIMAQGRGGTVAVVAPSIAVVDQLGPVVPDGELDLVSADLNRLGAAVLILGATRSFDSTGEILTVGANTVELRNSSANPLAAPEVILAGTNLVLLDAGGSVKATGAAPATKETFNVSGDGALFLASTGADTKVVRTNTSATPVGTLTVASGASMSASGSLYLDGAGDTIVASDVHIDTSALSISSSRVSLGDAPTGTGGVDLTTELLAGLSGLKSLNLVSATTIDLYGPINVGTRDGDGRPLLASLGLSAAALNGYGSGDKTFTAGVISFENAANRTATTLGTPDGTGLLSFNAMTSSSKGSGLLTLGAGSKTITGFSGVNLSADSQILGDGVGALQISRSGNLSLSSARVGTSAGADQQILNDVGRVRISTSGDAAALPVASLGGRLTITGTAIDQGGNIELPAGVLTLHATGAGGDITLGNGAVINASGGVRAFADTYAVADAGRINLTADQGNVVFVSGSKVDLSGATAPDKKTSGNAGTLSISATNGIFSNDATLAAGAAAGKSQGNFALDVHSMGDFSKLNGQLSAAGFNGAVGIRTRTGDVTIATGDKVVANGFMLAADAGSINVLGSINTSGGNDLSGDGGQISLWAGNSLTIGTGAVLNSNAGAVGPGGMDSRGGNITLGSVAGVVDLQRGTTISMLGTHAGSDGVLTLRAARNAANTDLAVSEIKSTVNGGKPIVLEAVKTYTASSLGGADGAGNLAVNTSGVMFADTQAFASSAGAIASRLELDSSKVQVRAGLDIRSSSDLTLSENWDLADDWKSGGVPVNVTLRAAGNLIMNGSLSDGFTTTDTTLAVARWTFGSGESASLRLAAGADLAAANPLSVIQGTGDFILAPGQLVRTGTGNIDIAAGHDVKLMDQASVIYTSGVPSLLSATQNALFPQPKPGSPRRTPPVSYTTGGGSITVTAGNDVTAKPTSQLTSDWLWRRGGSNPDGTILEGQNTTWWLNFENFQQGIGALGGGNITVQAGGNINNLAAVIPTTGRLIGAAGATPQASDLVISGGGTLLVNAGRNIASGIFEDDRGNARIAAGDAFISGRTVGDSNPQSGNADLLVHTILMLGDGTFDVTARSGIELGAATNATMVPQQQTNFAQYPTRAAGGSQHSYFYTVAPSTALNLTSAAGDVAVALDSQGSNNSLPALAPSGTYDINSFDTVNFSVVPPTLNAAALSGDITVPASSGVYLLPSAVGNLNLLAQGNINLLGTLQMFEADPQRVPNALRPAAQLLGAERGDNTGGNLDTIPLPLEPLYQGSTDLIRVVAQTGDITAVGPVTFPKSAQFVAAGDIAGLTYTGKNLSSSDVTSFEAGGRIVFDTLADPVTGALQFNSQGITLAGPGYLELLAGSSIDLGDSIGVLTSANLNDSRLSRNGAGLITAAGLGTDALGLVRQPAYQPFTNAYLAAQKDGAPSIYAQKLIDFLAQLDPNAYGSLDYSRALATFQALDSRRQLPFLAAVLNNELSETGLAHTREGLPYDRGFTAINTLFPTKDAGGNALTYQGDINLSFSQLKTEQGGSIDMLAPGGSVIVGLANPPASLYDVKAQSLGSAPANLGVLVLGSGAIHGLADDSFTVNQSRILTLEGGDIILWASKGDIDAGKGAKTASGAPPPVIQTDAKGNVFVNPVGAVSGSGIGQLLVKPNLTAGLVNLIAPAGVVNAGDAGIRVAGNLNIAAVQVIGAGNITVGGTATGVPQSDAGSLSGALSGANSLGDAGKAAVDQLSQNLGSAANSFKDLSDSLQPAFIVVRMFCLGVECDAR